MGIAKDMAAIATECLKSPRNISIWDERLGRYVCKKDPENFARALQYQARASRPPISSEFKIVFIACFGGTILFVFICVTMAYLVRGEMPETLDTVIKGLFDLAKIGFGAAVGLLGGKSSASRR